MITQSSLADRRRSYTRLKSAGRRKCSNGRNANGLLFGGSMFLLNPRRARSHLLRVQACKFLDQLPAALGRHGWDHDLDFDVLVTAVNPASFQAQACTT